MNIVRHAKLFVFVSAIFAAASAASVAAFGLNPGIEFTGGSILEVAWRGDRPSTGDVAGRLSGLALGLSSVQEAGERGMLLRMKDLGEEEHQAVLAALGEEAQELRFESIGPVIGEELRGRAGLLLALALLAIVLYVMFAFRNMRGSAPSWQWSFAALAALVHDIGIPLGVLAALGEFAGAEIGVPVVVALLTVVGYSVNDTVVVFDRVRENLVKKAGEDFADTVQKSVRQALARSLNTSFTTLLTVLALLFFGGETLRLFSLTLGVGIVAGTWSSLFLAPFLLTRQAKFGLMKK